jgi:hypothetical protein
MKIWIRAVLTIIIFVSSIVSAQHATSRHRQITGIYSDMSYNKEGDDILGIEIFLVYSRSGYWVVYQSSDGDPEPPIVLPATIRGDSIRFSLPANIDQRGDFTGTISANEMVGTFSGNGQIVHIRRRTSYWQ